MNRHKRILSVCVLVLLMLLAACDSPDETPIPTEVAIVKAVVTVGPTATLSEEDRIATQQAAPPTFIPTPIGPPPSPTPYIGQFMGESSIDPLVAINSFDPQVLALPTQPEPEFIPLLCAIARSPVFGTSWEQETNLYQQMGCPIQEPYGFTGVVQVFEGGVMYFNPDNGEVWAIAPGNFGDPGNYWYAGQVQGTAPNVLPPEGMLLPQGAFGALWVSIQQARENLGFAITGEQGIDVNVQRFDGGWLFRDITVGQVFVLAVNGNAYGPYQ